MKIGLKRFWLKKNIETFLGFLDEETLTEEIARVDTMTEAEIDEMVAAKGFHDNDEGNGVNYISDRLHLEDMHSANVFIDIITGKPTCIDCIVKFVKKDQH